MNRWLFIHHKTENLLNNWTGRKRKSKILFPLNFYECDQIRDFGNFILKKAQTFWNNKMLSYITLIFAVKLSISHFIKAGFIEFIVQNKNEYVLNAII